MRDEISLSRLKAIFSVFPQGELIGSPSVSRLHLALRDDRLSAYVEVLRVDRFSLYFSLPDFVNLRHNLTIIQKLILEEVSPCQ